MKLYYCDVCGLRIPATEIPPGDPEPEDGKYFCAKHRAAPLPAQQAKPPSGSVLQIPIPNAGSLHSRTKITPGAHANSPRITPAHHHSVPHPVKPASGNKNVLIFGTAGVIFVLLAAVISFSGGQKPTPERDTQVAQVPPATQRPSSSAAHSEPARTVDPDSAKVTPSGPGYLAPYAATTSTPDRPPAEAGVKPPVTDVTPATPSAPAEVNPLPDKPLPAPAITPAPPANPLNLLKDPGFESGGTTLWNIYNDVKVIEDPALAHSGKFCARLRAAGGPTMRQTVAGLTPGGRYIASVWIKGTHGKLGVREFIGPSSTVEIVKFATQSDEYQLVSIPFTMGPTWKSAKIYFQSNGSGIKDEAFFDDAILVPDNGLTDAAAPAEIKPPEDTPAQKFEILRDKAYALLQQGKSDAGLAILTEAKGDPQFAALAADFDTLAALFKTYDAVMAAAPDGLKKLSDGRAFTFRKKDKNSRGIPVGGTTKASVAELKDGEILIETKDGGMVATQKIVYEDLSDQCRLELAALALPPVPESELKLAFVEFIQLRSGRATAVPGLHAHLEHVKKDSTTASAGEFLQRELDLLAANQRADALAAKVDAAVKEGTLAQAHSLFAEMKKEFGATPPLHAKRYFDEHKDVELPPGLWASYFSGPAGKEFEKYHLSRVETRLEIEWGYNSPDPAVPVDFFTAKFCGFLRIEKPGTYIFTSKTDDVIDLSVDGQRVLENSTYSLVTGKITLAAGDHPIRVYYRDFKSNASLSLKWKLEGGFDTQEIPTSALRYDPSLKEQYQKPGR